MAEFMRVARSCQRRALGVSMVLAQVALGLLGGSEVLAADINLSVVAKFPNRRHLVPAGSLTTFVVVVRNDSQEAQSVRIDAEPRNVPWTADLQTANDRFQPQGSPNESLLIPIPAAGEIVLLARLRPPAQASDGEEGEATVTARLNDVVQSTVLVRGKVRNKPKVYFVAIDGIGPGYLDLNRRGGWYDGSAERLMPRASQFRESAASFTDAKALLPACTDVDHTAALSGSWTGTQGVPSIRRYYSGTKRNGGAEFLMVKKDLLRFGPSGEPVETIYDVIKDEQAGGDQDTFSVFVSGKEWVGELYADQARTVDILAGGKQHLAYIPEPEPFRFGDPPSDPDAEVDREGTNVSKSPRYNKLLSRKGKTVGGSPTAFPEDRWIAEAAVRMIAAEDPDVLYVILAESDTAQHTFGAADRPEEWTDPGTPDVLWDDINLYNPGANRDPVLDIVHEADLSFGLILDEIQWRDPANRSYVVLLADHGQVTVSETPIPVASILLSLGVSDDDIEYMLSRHSVTFLYLTDPQKSSAIAAALESYETFDPILKTNVHPFIAIELDEMESGIDNVAGHVLEDGITGNERGELYSEWAVEFPAPDASKVRWPHLMVFNRFRHQNALVGTQKLTKAVPGPSTIGTHASFSSVSVPLLMRGAGIASGVYPEDVTLADIVPTLYQLLGLTAPPNVDGKVLGQILSP